MTERVRQQLASLNSHLSAKRGEIMLAWRASSDADPEQTTADALTRSQFNDHIPQVLEALEGKLAARPGSPSDGAADDKQKIEEAKHGLHRWQQGYRLREVTREWGHLHSCLSGEVEIFIKENPDIDPLTVAEAHQQLLSLVNNAVNESLAQYVRMDKEAAASRAHDLERAIAELEEVGRQRGHLIRQAVHDLGGSVQAVTSAASMLGFAKLPDEQRESMAGTIERGVKSLRMMLGELMTLARLEAGQEERKVAPFNAADTLSELCAVSKNFAQERGLFLNSKGPQDLQVEGDRDKLHRITQNLLLNALKYTQQGGVTVSWGREQTEHWWVMVQDSGPGLHGGSARPVINELKQATQMADDGHTRESPPVAKPAEAAFSQSSAPGEGIGLAIVKRLCDLLDASIEVTSSPEQGTTFRVLFPLIYEKS